MSSIQERLLLRIAVSIALIALIAWRSYLNPHVQPGMWAIRAAVIAFSLWRIGANIALCGRLRTARTNAARNILNIQEKVYSSGLHQYRMASIDEFPQLDREFYEACRARFEAHGYRFAGDLENVTLSQAFPNMRSILRICLSADGTVISCCFHAQIPARPGQAAARDIRRIELETEFTDGTYITTNNGQDTPVAKFPNILVNALPATFPLEQLLLVHQQAVAQKLATVPGVRAVSCADIDAVIQVQHRLQSLKSHHKQTADWGAERQAQVGRPLTDAEQALADEMRRLKQQGGGS